MSNQDIKQLTATWLAGWNIEDRAFNGDVFRDVFAPGEGAISVFDNVQGDVIALHSVDDYIDTWVPFMAPMSHWAVEMEDLDIRVDGDMALSTFRIVGSDTRGEDGAQVPFAQYGTHVWQYFANTGWRLVHEHLTAYVHKQGVL